MGRLLEALKRLEPELSARPSTAQKRQDAATVEPSVNQRLSTLSTTRQTSYSDDSLQESAEEEIEAAPFEEVSEQIESLKELLDEELSHEAETARSIEPFDTEDETTANDAATVAFAMTDFDAPSEVEEDPFGFLVQPPEDFGADEFPYEPEIGVISGYFTGQTQTAETPSFADESDAESHRGVFAGMAINLLSQLDAQPTALLFTSSTDGEGKTETILPLAEAIVEASGRRTILVDANLHHPDLTQEWRFESRKGFFEVLTGEADWWEAVQETGIPKLSILVNNGLPSKNNLVTQPLAFSMLLEKLKREYELVLIDGASLAQAESIPMIRHCQGVYLVVRLGHSSRRMVSEARQVIDQAGGKLFGCIAVGKEEKAAG